MTETETSCFAKRRCGKVTGLGLGHGLGLDNGTCRKLSFAVLSWQKLSAGTMKENIVDVMRSRGLLDQITHEELKKAAEMPLRVYCGFDPTGDSLHLGNMVAIMGLAWFQSLGISL